MAPFVVSLLLLCLATESTLAQYGRSAPRSSSLAGYRSSTVNKPTSKPSTTGGYGGSYGGIYDNPSATVEEIGPVEEDEELEEVEPPPPRSSGASSSNRAGYGTFREPPVESAASFSSVNSFNGVRYAPQQSAQSAHRPSASSFGRQSFTTARPRRVNPEEDVLPLEEVVDEFEPVPTLGTFKQQQQHRQQQSRNYGRPSYSSVGGNTQFGAVQGPQMSQRRRNAVVYGGSVPQLFSHSGSNGDNGDFGEDNNDDDESQMDSELPEVSASQYGGGNGRGGSSKKRTGASPVGRSSYGGGSVPSKNFRSSLGGSAHQQQQRSNGPINAAIQSTHQLQFHDVPSSSSPAEPVTIEVAPNQNEIQFRFKSASSKLNIESEHEPSPGSYSETSSEDEAHVIKHTVVRPIIQEITEILSPKRTIIQEIQPVQENVQTIVARGEPKEKQSTTASAASDVNGGKAKSSSGAQRSSSSGAYGRPPTAASGQSINSFNSGNAFAFSKPSPKQTNNGFASGYGAASNFASPSIKPKKANGNNGNGNSNGQFDTPVGTNGQAMLKMSFNYGPSSGSSNSFNGPSSSTRSGYGSSGNFGSMSAQSGSRSANFNSKHKSSSTGGSASSQALSGGYGSSSTSFTDDQQSTGSISVDRVGNGVAYKMMTFTMGSDAMQKQKQQQSGPNSSSRSGYGSSTGRLSSGNGGNSARNAKLIFSGSDSQMSSGGRRRSISSSTATANARLPRINTDALIEDELDNGEINVPLPINDEPTAAAATGGMFFVSNKPKTARGQLGRTRDSYKKRAA